MKKSILLSSLLALGISGLGSIAKADEISINGGSENVDNYIGLVRSEISDQPLNQDSTVFKYIAAGPVNGGYWIRGTNSAYVISRYKHYKKEARASVVNGIGGYNGTPWNKPGSLATAQLKKTKHGNKAYYDHK
ncbi:hypothetical protein C7J88_00720 [Staphylococcus muscae]|uniref:Bacteriocin, lactococcin 972 family n=1 Tax=Staphylococcus muscae TaxID=1294 RepID=A0A240C0Y3_9STAP|nr:lactococcin 972 family bacteriocin [Staphylococcus muscae]AVQ32795.1 hypothetical protein C7J88_00720 [Staphylococcus muscae]PNY99646.1 hypothetical protein CD131_09985 [Staphylococcus muscae]GGA81109.1 hypothetical protein GCM10007183_01550 [Staphylococcus muscae]SNW01667.1 bacteriocin, lactococcin 972 family [Staphylococcus muscae]